MKKERTFRAKSNFATIYWAFSILFVFSFQTAALAQSPIATYKLRMPINAAATENYYRIAVQCAKDAKDMSNGKLEIEILPMGLLVPITEAWEAVGKGAVDMAHVFAGYHAGKFAVADIESGSPFAFRNEQDMRVFWHDYGFLDFLNEEVYANTNTYVLGQVYFSGYQLWLKRPAKSIDDLRRMKLRIAGPISKIMGKLNISPTFVPGAEVYTALATGVLDGAAYGGIVQGYDLKFYEVAKYILSPQVQGVSACTIYINRKLYQSLPEDIKVILKYFALSFNDRTNRDFDVREVRLLSELKDKRGLQFSQLNDASLEALKKASSDYLQELGNKDATTRKGVDLYNKFAQEYLSK